MVAYHDHEWGVPLHDDRRQFEFLVLETMQAGLSWRTVLLRREGFREIFRAFDPAALAACGEADVTAWLADPRAIRHRGKLEALVANARAFLELAAKEGGFAPWLWSFTAGRPIDGRRRTMAEVPAVTPLATTIARELKRRGFKFLGPTTVYAHLQAAGHANDHLESCFRHGQVGD